ncbi:MAG: hypothetical protein V4530_04530 [Pseudomonadota bacterium]
MTPDDPNRPEFDRRRRSRAIVTALLLGAMVLLFYFISIAKMVVNAA